jgi:hypothetical protein
MSKFIQKIFSFLSFLLILLILLLLFFFFFFLIYLVVFTWKESCSQPQLVWIKTAELSTRLLYSFAASVSIISVILGSFCAFFPGKGLLVNILTRHILSLDRFLIIEHKVGTVKHVMSLLFNLFGGSWNQNIAISYGLSSLLLQSGLAWPNFSPRKAKNSC